MGVPSVRLARDAGIGRMPLPQNTGASRCRQLLRRIRVIDDEEPGSVLLFTNHFSAEPRVASSAPIPAGGSITQLPCSTTKPCCARTTARVSRVIRPRRGRRSWSAFLMLSRPMTSWPSTTRTALVSYRAIKASTSPRLKACWKRLCISAGLYAGIRYFLVVYDSGTS